MPSFSAQDGAQLHYLDEGNGKPVLALSGLARDVHDFDYVAPFLTGVRLIRMDYRGRGQSEWTGPETYTIPQESADVLALLDHLGLEQVAVLGTSRGGLIAMGLAATAKQRLSGVCLVDIGPEIADAGMETIKGYLGKNPAARTYAEAQSVRANLIQGFANVSDERWAQEVRIHYKEADNGLSIRYDPALREAVLGTAPETLPDLWPFFDALQDLPLALVRGANSELLTKETADAMSERRPDMLRVDVPDRGHVPFLDEPESLEIIQQWLGRLP